MTAWSRENGIVITGDAQALIVVGFEEKEAWLKEVMSGPRTYNWMPNTLLAAVVRTYLYELRDRISDDTVTRQPAVAFRFQAGAQAAGKVIAAAQVRRQTVADFLRTVVKRLSGEVVSLKIESTPQPLYVYVDNIKKSETNTELILSPGKYTLEIRTSRGKALCTERLDVLPGPQDDIHCPEEKN
jgi:hypothetical protein